MVSGTHRIRVSVPPELPVEGAVLDGFGDMGDLNVVHSTKIGDGAGNFKQAVVGEGGEAELLNGRPKQRFDRVGGGPPGANLLWPHLRVAVDRSPGLGRTVERRGTSICRSIRSRSGPEIRF